MSRLCFSRACLPSSALHALGEHAAVLWVKVSGVVPERRRMVRGPVRWWGAHSVTVRRRRASEEGPETSPAWQQRRRTAAGKSCHLDTRDSREPEKL